MADFLTISELRRQTRAGSIASAVRAQIEDITRKEDRNAKPYWEIKLRDVSDAFTLKVWSNSPFFSQCDEWMKGDVVQVDGEFGTSAYGLEAQRWGLRPLTTEERESFFAGDELTQRTNEEDFVTITELVASIRDPRLLALGQLFLQEFGPRFRRTAAARANHHAFRGGLLRHTAQMMKSANAICGVYPALNRDLLLAGVLFHDSGKLWETCPPEEGFEIPRELRGELLGHISIGIELVNKLWQRVQAGSEDWKNLVPSSEEVRLHLLHLIAAHHGELQFGSPITPKTPEAMALHYVDNLDARLEMVFAAYEKQPEIAPGVYDRVWALNNSFPVRPLPPLAS